MNIKNKTNFVPTTCQKAAASHHIYAIKNVSLINGNL